MSLKSSLHSVAVAVAMVPLAAAANAQTFHAVNPLPQRTTLSNGMNNGPISTPITLTQDSGGNPNAFSFNFGAHNMSSLTFTSAELSFDANLMTAGPSESLEFWLTDGPDSINSFDLGSPNITFNSSGWGHVDQVMTLTSAQSGEIKNFLAENGNANDLFVSLTGGDPADPNNNWQLQDGNRFADLTLFANGTQASVPEPGPTALAAAIVVTMGIVRFRRRA